ncbi:MAG TPA: diadenylate cyclase CdaA [Tenuifilaceae bacterium]|nr:diadenylate cyclase CdaA [Tenuifilaceae bacterium]HPE17965.1 diadenylate cyclase CdaA [Tenuifilaceae bacterium]HPJ44913.1 diadenylate cyclase CdaA [Tenuifilaceae bacterium]HPQ33121.1 diadenylate cyclase CdaA [Tenuifilaceae bacterium]HRX67053.1 diadenylate cyclase CdaA [Tenuifilaceae bacterium]
MFTSFILTYISVRILDVIDILLVAFLLYQIYMLIRGTVAINIFMGIFILYLFWIIVRAFNMELLSSILGQIIGVGVIALIIVFQQEIRKFLLLIGTKYLSRNSFSIENLFFSKNKRMEVPINVEAIVKACRNMSETKTGALIVLSRRSDLQLYAETGDIINADTSSRLLENIFFKNSPLHDGAVIIKNDKIVAARCVLPLTERLNLPASYGLRHKAAIGLSENTDAIVVIVSEETGRIALVSDGNIKIGISSIELQHLLEKKLQE